MKITQRIVAAGTAGVISASGLGLLLLDAPAAAAAPREAGTVAGTTADGVRDGGRDRGATPVRTAGLVAVLPERVGTGTRTSRLAEV
ncbi:hypothetical protein [Kineococcus glutinatus]